MREGLPIVILGAGLSGLSLAHALLDASVSAPIVLVDRRRSWARDRTWCTWLTGPLRFAECETYRWEAWRTRLHGREAIARSGRHPYIHLDGERVYARALDRLEKHPRVEIRSGEAVRSVRTGEAGPVVQTTDTSIDASLVFDAMGARSPLLRRRPGAIELAQRFVGWEVEAERPVFDPTTATLMDFRPHAGVGVTFLYVLPFSPTRALLEHTSIEPLGAPAVDRDAALDRELREHHGLSSWTTVRRESGLIPMTTFPFPATHGPGVHTVGAAAGAVRPSSGYAFSRIQGHVSRVAAAVAAGSPLPAHVSHARHELLDRVFLEAIVRGAPAELFLALAREVPGEVMARFMTDVSGPLDEARIVASLPLATMTGAALRTLSSPAAARALLRRTALPARGASPLK